MTGWHHWLNGHEFEQTLGDSDSQGSLACCSPWGPKESHSGVTEQQSAYLFVPYNSPSVQFSRSVVSDSLWPYGLQHARLPCPSSSPRACSNSCPLSWWCHPTISSSVVPFSSCLQSFPASGSFPMSHFLASGGQSIRASASASVLLMSIQGWFPLGLTGLISLHFIGPSRVDTTIWRYHFFGTRPSSWSSSHIHAWLLKIP